MSKWKAPSGIGGPFRFSRVDDGDIARGGFDHDFGVIDRFTEEVIRAHGAGHVIAGPVAAFGFCVLAREVEIDFETRENIALDLQGKFRLVRLCGIGFVHERAQMVRAEIDFIGQTEFG